MIDKLQHNLGSLSFGYICRIAPEMDSTGQIKIFMPQSSYQKRPELRLNAYGTGPFCRFRIPKNLPYEGVYILTLNDEPFYVGECRHLSRRYNMGYGQISPRNCYQGGQPTNCRINHLIYQAVSGHQQVDLWFLETANRFEVESTLIQALQTRARWNRKD